MRLKKYFNKAGNSATIPNATPGMRLKIRLALHPVLGNKYGWASGFQFDIFGQIEPKRKMKFCENENDRTKLFENQKSELQKRLDQKNQNFINISKKFGKPKSKLQNSNTKN